MGEIVPINCRQIGMRCTSRLPYIALPSFAGALISGALGSLPGLFAFSLATGATVGVWRRDRIRCWSGHIDNGAPDCEDMHAHIAGPPARRHRIRRTHRRVRLVSESEPARQLHPRLLHHPRERVARVRQRDNIPGAASDRRARRA